MKRATSMLLPLCMACALTPPLRAQPDTVASAQMRLVARVVAVGLPGVNGVR
jgi:hypothetical protein